MNSSTIQNRTAILNALTNQDFIIASGRIKQVIGLLIESEGPVASIGDVCHIRHNSMCIGVAEVVGFRLGSTLLMSLGPIEGICAGMQVVSTKAPLKVALGPQLLGRVIDGLGNPIDGKGPLRCQQWRSCYSKIPNPLSRMRITEQLQTGIRAIDSLLSIGKGQRMGIFSGSGVGKSVLLGMMAKNCSADVNVIALIGERGREVREFIERDLGPEGLKRSVVVVATSNEPALIRIKGAVVAATIAEYFRDEGNDVLFMADSATRLAHAAREVGLATGEPPATRGYTPSVFAQLSQFLERAGTSDRGTITGLYTVLVDGDDLDEPIADAARSILDGHIVLSRKLAAKNHFPAIDVLQSISRCMNDIVSPKHTAISSVIKDRMGVYRENEDLIQIGAYAPGTNKSIDDSIAMQGKMLGFLRQNRTETESLQHALSRLEQIVAQSGTATQ